MIETVQNAIIGQIETIDGLKTVGEWQGDIEDLLKMPQRLPAMHVIYQGADFEEKKTIGGDQAANTMDFLIVLVGKNQKSRAAGAVSCFTLIESARDVLIGLKIPDCGYLWPVREDLILAAGGTLAYGLIYRLCDALWEEE